MTDPLAEIRRWADMVAAAQMERDEARRTYVVPDRELAVQIEAIATALGVDDLVTVVTNPLCPPGQAFVIDDQALKAAGAESLQHAWRRPMFG